MNEIGFCLAILFWLKTSLSNVSSPQVKFKEAEVVEDPGEETADGVGNEFVLDVVEF